MFPKKVECKFQWLGTKFLILHNDEILSSNFFLSSIFYFSHVNIKHKPLLLMLLLLGASISYWYLVEIDCASICFLLRFFWSIFFAIFSHFHPHPFFSPPHNNFVETNNNNHVSIFSTTHTKCGRERINIKQQYGL